ncbi:MAG: hypothetical protein N2321_01565 [Melioribacteraceae bacterium]|nr:hypothetical protein [Melioribacteraceae bacterium]
MKKIILFFLLITSSFVKPQYQDEFYNYPFAFGIVKTFIMHSLNPIGGIVTTSEGERKYEKNPTAFSITLWNEWNQTGKWAFNLIFKSQFLNDFVPVIVSAINSQDENKSTGPWFCSILEFNCGLNFYYDRTTRAAAGLSANSFVVNIWDSQGNYNAQRGSYMNLGPYINGDYLLSNEWMLKGSFQMVFPVVKFNEVKEAKNPYFVNFTTGIMNNNGLYFGIDYTIILGMTDSATKKEGPSLSGSRLEIKLAWFLDF